MINNFFNIFLNSMNFHLEFLSLSLKNCQNNFKKQVTLRNLAAPGTLLAALPPSSVGYLVVQTSCKRKKSFH